MKTPLTINRDQLNSFLEALEAASMETGVEYQLNKLPFFPLKKSVYLHDGPSDIHFSYFTQHNQFGCVGGNTVVGIKSNGVVMACGFVPIKYAIPGNSVLEKPFLKLWNESENITVLRNLIPNDKCKSCSLLSVCGGGCRANALLHNHSLNAIDPYCFWMVDQNDFAFKKPVNVPTRNLDADAATPFLSMRTIVTKCGSGTML
jgi:radical SAM protein with 4Fe4S-binding SPASM domain